MRSSWSPRSGLRDVQLSRNAPHPLTPARAAHRANPGLAIKWRSAAWGQPASELDKPEAFDVILMILGLALFLGVHLIPAFPPLRRAIAGPAERRYKGMFSIASAIGLVLIVAGYWSWGPTDRVFAPVMAARVAAPWIVTL